MYATIGKIIITIIEIVSQISLQFKNVKRKTINTGNINSAKDKPSQQVLNAFPLLFSKNLEMVVVAVWVVKPCPDSLIKNIPTNKKITDEIFEKIKQEIDKKIITYDANLITLTSSIFFPIQTKTKLLKSVAEA